MGRTPQPFAYDHKILSTTQKAKCGWEVGHALSLGDKIILFFLQDSCLVCRSPDRGLILAGKG